MSDIISRLARLRGALSQHKLSAFIVMSADPHLSEYLPPRWQGREWISGFTGSVGTVVVTQSEAWLWVDSRYWEQAEAQLAGSGIGLMRAGQADVPEPGDWLARSLPRGAEVGVDGMVLAVSAGRRLEQSLTPAGLVLRTEQDLLDEIWDDRPGLPQAPVRAHDPAFAPESRVQKLDQVRAAMRQHDTQIHIISALDDIAWLTNLRGQDVNYNPVFLAHVILETDTARLFVGAGKLDDALAAQLEREGYTVCDYADFAAALGEIGSAQRVLVDPARMTRGALAALDSGVTQVESINPSTLLKACKSAGELAHVRHAMEQDGAALCQFFSWLERNIDQPGLTELTVDQELTARRRARPGFVSLSFPTIAGFNANGAMPHYRATVESHSPITGDGLLLIDSGAQYLGGTTDITRVIPIGQPNEAQKRDFTLVLKGMINLSMAQFPDGLPAPALDALARAPVWAGGADYGHGTGHGVGYFLNVHEGPQVISYRAQPLPHTAMRAGMITSNEPGLYRAGQWGVRIENLVANVPAESSPLGEFLRFETLTLCPIDTRCVVLALMRPDEIDWLNAYHAEVQSRLAPLLEGDDLLWLTERCAPI